jgi:ribosomal protein S18 acetylase RimI-like enzyme
MPYPALRVREATPADLDLLVDLSCRTFEAAFGADNDPADMAAYLASAFSRSQLQQDLLCLRSVFLLADAVEPGFPPGPSPLGYARLLGESVPPCGTGPRPMELNRLYLDPAVQGQGYGSALMQICLERAIAAGYQTLWLGVWEHNHRALAFYRRWGFEPIGVQGFQLGRDRQTDYILARSLSAPTAPDDAP